MRGEHYGHKKNEDSGMTNPEPSGGSSGSGPKFIPPTLRKKLGPLPLYAWGIIAAVGVGGAFYFLRSRGGGSAGDSGKTVYVQPDDLIGPYNNQTGGGGGSGGGAGDGSPTTPAVPTPPGSTTIPPRSDGHYSPVTPGTTMPPKPTTPPRAGYMWAWSGDRQRWEEIPTRASASAPKWNIPTINARTGDVVYPAGWESPSIGGSGARPAAEIPSTQVPVVPTSSYIPPPMITGPTIPADVIARARAYRKTYGVGQVPDTI